MDRVIAVELCGLGDGETRLQLLRLLVKEGGRSSSRQGRQLRLLNGTNSQRGGPGRRRGEYLRWRCSNLIGLALRMLDKKVIEAVTESSQ